MGSLSLFRAASRGRRLPSSEFRASSVCVSQQLTVVPLYTTVRFAAHTFLGVLLLHMFILLVQPLAFIEMLLLISVFLSVLSYPLGRGWRVFTAGFRLNQ